MTVRADKVTEFADAGDFERDHAFSFGAWVKLPKAGLIGSILARMDDRQQLSRLGPLARKRPHRHSPG